jgi:16S rRNA (uracil1498-N3)-methyltransferase
LKTDFDGTKYIAHCENGEKKDLKTINKTEKTIILIGPEGDFSQKEIELALENQFNAVNLAKSRLRTETAGIIAVHTINII